MVCLSVSVNPRSPKASLCLRMALFICGFMCLLLFLYVSVWDESMTCSSSPWLLTSFCVNTLLTPHFYPQPPSAFCLLIHVVSPPPPRLPLSIRSSIRVRMLCVVKSLKGPFGLGADSPQHPGGILRHRGET